MLAAVLLGVLAHGDLHEQIQAVTAEIAKDPRNAVLYLKRGELHRFHEELQPARADLDQAAKLDPKLPGIDLARGRLEQQFGDAKAAVEAIDRFLVREPGHAEARFVRARALARAGDPKGAAEEYTRGLAIVAEPRPEHFLERAEALAALGPERLAEAIQGLDEGVKKLGPIVTLQLGALDLEVRARRFDAALERIDRMTSEAPRKDSWLARRGDVLRQAGRLKEAREAYAAALASMDTLSPRQRAAKSTQELDQRLRAALKELAGTPP